MMPLSAVALTLVRWYLLVRSLGLPFTLRDALRLGFLAEGAIQFPIVTARLDASLRIDQEVHLHDRAALAELDVTTLSGAVSVEIPIGTGPEAPVFGIGGRYRRQRRQRQ